MLLAVAAQPEEARFLRTLLDESFHPLITHSTEEALQLAGHHPLSLALISFREPADETYDLIQGLLDLHQELPIILLCDTRQIQAVRFLFDLHLATPLLRPVTSATLREKIRLMSPAPEGPSALRTPAAAVQEPLPAKAVTGADPGETEHLIMDLAHRLKNPLVVVRTFTHLLRERFNDAQFQKDFYQTMRQEVERMDALIDQLIEFAEMPDPVTAPHPVLPLLEEAARQAKEQLKNTRIRIQNEQNEQDKQDKIEDPEATVWVDRDQLIYALVQLLVAFGHTLAKTGQLEAQVRTPQGTDQEGIEILIRTGGTGARDQSLLIGLELFMAKRIIERQRGSFESHIPPEGRMSVKILLPSAGAAQRDWAPSPQINAAGERRKRQFPIVFKDRRQVRTPTSLFFKWCGTAPALR